MIALLRLSLIGLAVVTVVFLVLRVYARSVQREKLEKQYDATFPQGERSARDAYVAQGLREYRHSLRRRLIWLVYLVPVALVVLAVYINNVR